jgi:hypothetical protein
LEVGMKKSKRKKAGTIFGLFFLSSALIIGILFLGANQLFRSNSIGGDVFAQGIKDENNLIVGFAKYERGGVGREGIKGIRGEVDPVFIIHNGHLVDPSQEAKRVGSEDFIGKWFRGKTFSAYRMGRNVGKLKDFTMYVGGKGRCPGELWGEAIYEEEGVWDYPPPIKIGGNSIYKASSSDFGLARKDDLFFFKDESEESQIPEAYVRKLIDSGGLEFEKMIQRLKKPARDVEVEKEWRRGLRLQHIDLDGNGKSDLIGVFDVLLKYKYAGGKKATGRSPAQYPFKLIYILYDNGKGEIIWPSFQNGTWRDGYSTIQGFFNLGEIRPAILMYSWYPTNFFHYQNDPYQYELLGHCNGKGWVTIFKGGPKRDCGR